MSFRLVPNSVTLDDLERRNSPKRMGVDHEKDRGDKSPRIGSGGTLMQIVPPDFVI